MLNLSYSTLLRCPMRFICRAESTLGEFVIDFTRSPCSVQLNCVPAHLGNLSLPVPRRLSNSPLRTCLERGTSRVLCSCQSEHITSMSLGQLQIYGTMIYLRTGIRQRCFYSSLRPDSNLILTISVSSMLALLHSCLKMESS